MRLRSLTIAQSTFAAFGIDRIGESMVRNDAMPPCGVAKLLGRISHAKHSGAVVARLTEDVLIVSAGMGETADAARRIQTRANQNACRNLVGAPCNLVRDHGNGGSAASQFRDADSCNPNNSFVASVDGVRFDYGLQP